MENPLARRKDLVTQDVSDELLIYDLLTDKAYCLNRSAALVWKFCDGKNSIDDVVRRFEETGGGSVGKEFVWVALGQLNDSGLLDSPIPRRFQGRSRRELIKTLGLASAVAVPLVASLVVPGRTGGVPISCTCVNPAQCITMPQCPSTQNCNPLGQCAPNSMPRSDS